MGINLRSGQENMEKLESEKQNSPGKLFWKILAEGVDANREEFNDGSNSDPEFWREKKTRFMN